MKISEIMNREVECAEPALPIAKAAAKMRELNIGFLPICENGMPVGTVTDRDITIQSVAQGRDPWEAPVREIMRPEVFYCYDDQDVEEVARHMQEREVRRMIIMNRDNKITGVVSLGDIAKLSVEKQMAGETLGKIAEAA